jgi:hypothetical protein
VKIAGDVAPDEVPLLPGANMGQWTGLAKLVIEAYEQGRVLVVMAADKAEYRRMINGMSEVIRQRGYSRRFVTVDEPEGVRVYCRLLEKQPPARATVVVRPLKRQRKRANA